MRWFEDGIPRAIQTAKSNKSVFIVFITGEEEKSAEMESFLQTEDVTTVCEENRCVAIRITSNSNDVKLFSQIYPVVVIPSTFFIGDNGVPLEVIGECKSHEDFLAKVKNAIEVKLFHSLPLLAWTCSICNGGVRLELQKKSTASGAETSQSSHQQAPSVAPQQAPSVPPQQTSLVPPQQTPSVPPQNEKILTGEEDLAGATGGESAVVGNGDEGADSGLTLEERVEKARLLVEYKREEKMRKEAEEAKKREIERRNIGQGVQKLREKQKEMDILEAKKELKKDRDEEKLARQRVKDEIERDRQEKAARFGKDKDNQLKVDEAQKKKRLLEQQAAQAIEQARKSDIARIQFRLPDGSSVTQNFPGTEKFAVLNQFITQHMGSAVNLSMAFPRRTFTTEDHSLTLQELQLAPSAVILVIPAGISTSEVRGSSSLSLARITNLLFSPIFFLWNLLTSIFGLSGSSARPGSAQSSHPPSTARGGERNQGSAQKRPASSSRQEGSVRRFRNAQDDDNDDESNTWNGNSTQQM